MSELKFRLWDKFSKTMVYFDSIAFLNIQDDVLLYRNAPDNDPHGFDELSDTDVIMQYTGIKDKNKRYIYEGDIIKETYKDDYAIGIVVFQDGAYTVEFANDDYLLIGCDSEHTEVIGNIYEDVNLINSGKI